MSKHTPGPWNARHTPFRGQGIQDVWCIDWSPDQEEVAEIVHGAANARLIAAAPDLLEALQDMVSDHASLSAATLAFARAAIAKATGEQP